MTTPNASMTAPAKSDWQPIETAPKDGTEILIASDCFVEAAYWEGKDSLYPWVTLDGQHVTNGRQEGIYGPTHWQPLPAPPLPEGPKP